jgi:hypothetical protein
MSKNIHRTAQGRPIDMDALRLSNEQSIAIGNMKTNARGDELGPGGVVVRTRNQVVNDYYQSNAVYTKESVEDQEHQTRAIRSGKNIEADPVEMPTDIDPEILAQDEMMDEISPADAPQLRGRLADAVAKTANVEQKVIQPRRKAQGIKRI